MKKCIDGKSRCREPVNMNYCFEEEVEFCSKRIPWSGLEFDEIRFKNLYGDWELEDYLEEFDGKLEQ